MIVLCIIFNFLLFFFSNLRGLECFMRLEELVLDNNFIDDNTKFPKLNQLQTLTLNKNKVSFNKSLLQPFIPSALHNDQISYVYILV